MVLFCMDKMIFKKCLIFLTLAVLVFGLAACSSSEGKKSKKTISETSAIDEYLFGKEDTSEKLRSAYESIEKDTLKCMNEKGWEYYKTQISDEDLSIGIFQEYTGFVDTQKREKFGYGVFTTLKSDGQSNDELSDEYYGFVSVDADKNSEYVDTLSESEQSKYFEDLYGEDLSSYTDEEKDNSGESDLDTGEGSIEQESEAPGLSDTSCSGAASKKAFGDLSTIQTIFADSQDVVGKFFKNKEVKSAISSWKSCIKDGLDKTGKTEMNKAVTKVLGSKDLGDLSPNEIINNGLQEVLSKLQGNDAPSDDIGALDSSANTIGPGGEVSYDDFQESKKFDPKKYAEQELKIAGLDYKCQEDKYLDVKNEQQRILEEKFIEDHKKEFTSLKKSLNS